ncbi:MAG: DUF6599 family protein [Pseudomonadota bacterium]
MAKYCWALLLMLAVYSTDALAADDLKRLLPTGADFSEIASVGEPVEARGEQLFQLIDGGAVSFLKHGFVRAIFQEYVLTDGHVITVELYQMASPGGAEIIYREKRGDGGRALKAGTNGALFDYYGLLHQGVYYVTITADAASPAVQEKISALARTVSERLK